MNRKRPEAGSNVVAVFDLDGTLTRKDTSLPFVSHAIGRRRLTAILAARGPLFLMDLLRAARRELASAGAYPGVRGRWEVEAHRRILDGALGGASRESLERLGQEFAHEVLDGFVADAASAQLRWHQAQGHRCVLASASLSLYVDPWAKRMGFDHAVATRLSFDERGRFSGRFDGEACWGSEKLRRVRMAVGSFAEVTTVVYGNKDGDAALLAAADLAILIRGAGCWVDSARVVRSALRGNL